MNEVTRTVTEEILGRADEAIERGEARGPKLDQCWKRLEKLNGGIVGPKSWEQIKKIAEGRSGGWKRAGSLRHTGRLRAVARNATSPVRVAIHARRSKARPHDL